MSVRFASVQVGILGLCLLASSFAAQAAEKRLDRTFSVSPGGRLTIDSDGSDLRVEGTSGNQVEVHILVKGSDRVLERMELTAEQSGNDVSVMAKRNTGKWTDFFGSWSQEGRVEVKVPHNYNIDIRTAGGDIVVGQLQGDARGKTSGGDIKVTELRGPVEMQTSGGDIRAEQIEGNTRLGTSGGDVDVARLTGDLDAKTSGGYIHLSDISGKVVARTSSGNVIASGIRGDSDLKTSGGDIRATIDGKIAAHTSGGNVTAELIGANRGISVSSSGGDLVVRVPKDTAGALDASTSGGSVRTDIPVTTTEMGEHKLTGTFNGGGNAIYARTSGGSIKVVASTGAGTDVEK
ncbi:MAG TPA: DUF4097 family beta strand repeat-containing protein [Steroidobacteraceae bacterium]|nr:DUF4097 family beta strand repeat-containing protein [Steroidobacteraceae bacterium]